MKQDDGYIAYIVNPKSGASSSKRISRRFYHYLTDNGYDVRVSITKSLDNARELAEGAAADAECALAVVVGGDGTIREALRGLQGSNTPLIIVPGGTENLLANELGIDERLRTLIKTFEGGYTRPLDLGSANERCFTSIAGFGFDAQVVRDFSSQRKGNIDHFDYFWPIWRTFWNYKFNPMKVEVDGEEIFDGPCLIFVGNISRYAMSVEILQKANYSDGLLDVCVYKCKSRLHLAKHAMMTLLRIHSKCSDVIYRQGTSIKVSSNHKGMSAEFDGDPGPSLPVEISVIPHAVNVMVPKGAKPAGIRTRLVRAIG